MGDQPKDEDIGKVGFIAESIAGGLKFVFKVAFVVLVVVAVQEYHEEARALVVATGDYIQTGYHIFMDAARSTEVPSTLP
jgi:hypothetical protein